MLDNTAGPQKPTHGSCQEVCLPLAAEASMSSGILSARHLTGRRALRWQPTSLLGRAEPVLPCRKLGGWPVYDIRRDGRQSAVERSIGAIGIRRWLILFLLRSYSSA